LQNLHELKNAEERLNLCEISLEKCYGSNLSRLSLIKSESANKHVPIYVRLNLLKGILNYHKGKKKESKEYLDVANKELQKITIDEEKLTQVMTMGFTNMEAKLALRATFNNVDSAVELIFQKREREKESKELEKQKSHEKKIESKYGRTTENKPIDTKVLKDLVLFGYAEKNACHALKQSNNNFNLALDILQSSPSEQYETGEKSEMSDDALLSQLHSMGYDLELCKLCLQAFDSDLNKALNFFLENKNSLHDAASIKCKLEDILKISDNTLDRDKQTKAEKAHKANQLLNNIVKDMPDDDEAYLDLNMEEDSFYINKYYSLLEI
jgi:hypothetical protein